jgi:hypothetical protein
MAIYGNFSLLNYKFIAALLLSAAIKRDFYGDRDCTHPPSEARKKMTVKNQSGEGENYFSSFMVSSCNNFFLFPFDRILRTNIPVI